jgi:protein-S-isoprenylcysteine O-methyltransferase Ste14
MHEPPVFIYWESIIFWIIFIWSFYLEIFHSGIITGANNNPQDAGTLRLINIGSDIALFLAFVFSFLPWLTIPNPRLALYIGTILLVIGILFRRYSIKILGKYFTAAVIVNTNQPVITKGPYRWIRHPGYAGGFLMFIGIGISLGNWLSLIVFLLEIYFVYRKRIIAEEKALLETLGEPYREYMTNTKRFIPFVF